MASALVVDDHPVVSRGCRRLLEDAGDTTFFEASDAATGFELFCRHRPDVVIIDLALGENRLGGLSLIQGIYSHDPWVRILVLSMYSDPLNRMTEIVLSGFYLDSIPE